MRKLDANKLRITDHARERFIERYRKKDPTCQKTDGEIIHTMLSFINKATVKHTWNVLTRPDLYKHRNHQHSDCYSYKGWVFVVGEDGEDGRVLLTCKRIRREQN